MSCCEPKVKLAPCRCCGGEPNFGTDLSGGYSEYQALWMYGCYNDRCVEKPQTRWCFDVNARAEWNKMQQGPENPWQALYR